MQHLPVLAAAQRPSQPLRARCQTIAAKMSARSKRPAQAMLSAAAEPPQSIRKHRLARRARSHTRHQRNRTPHPARPRPTYGRIRLFRMANARHWQTHRQPITGQLPHSARTDTSADQRTAQSRAQRSNPSTTGRRTGPAPSAKARETKRTWDG